MISDNQFRQIVETSIDKLPENFKKALANIEIVVEDEPTVEDMKVFGDRKLPGAILLGLYRGIPLPKRSARYANVLPDKISLFRKSIEKVTANDQEMIIQIYRTLLHEIGHYFGLNDIELRKLGF